MRGFEHNGGAEGGVREVPCHDMSCNGVVWCGVKKSQDVVENTFTAGSLTAVTLQQIGIEQ